MGHSQSSEPVAAEALPADAPRYIKISGSYKTMVQLLAAHVQKTQDLSFRNDPDAVIAAVERAIPPCVGDFGIHLIYYYEGKFYNRTPRTPFERRMLTGKYKEHGDILTYDKTYYRIVTAAQTRELPRDSRWINISKREYPIILIRDD